MKQFSLKEYNKNPNRKVVTRDGRNVTIHCTNFRGIFPIIAEIESVGKSFSYNEDGKTSYVGSSVYDLFFAPEKHEGWINLYRNECGTSWLSPCYFTSKKAAEEEGKNYTCNVTTIKIEWEE